MPKAKKAKEEKEAIKIGEVAFLAGVLIAVISGILAYKPLGVGLDEALIAYVLFGLGVLVGLLNLRKEEYTTFLLASLIFLVPLTVGAEQLSGLEWLFSIIKFIGVFVLPAALIVAFKAIWDTASQR